MSGNDSDLGEAIRKAELEALHFTPDATEVEEREALRVAVQSVLWNASNYPKPVQARLLGQDISSLTAKVVGAVSVWLARRDARVRNEAKAEAAAEAIAIIRTYHVCDDPETIAEAVESEAARYREEGRADG